MEKTMAEGVTSGENEKDSVDPLENSLSYPKAEVEPKSFIFPLVSKYLGNPMAICLHFYPPPQPSHDSPHKGGHLLLCPITLLTQIEEIIMMLISNEGASMIVPNGICCS